jgi:hypothetical protein
VWPRDVAPDSDLGRAFRDRLLALEPRARAAEAPRVEAALRVVAFAAGAPPRVGEAAPVAGAPVI